jgi:SAM-dependent methyltransferase
MSYSTIELTEYRAWKQWDKVAFGKYTRVESVTFHRELEMAGCDFSQRLSVLEIGFGNGHFATWAKDQGWNVVATELDPILVSRAVANGIEAHDGLKPIEQIVNGRLFDLIVAFDVLEHLDVADIIGLLSAARRCLKSGGHFIARFPSGDSPFAGSVQNSDLTHRSLMGTGIVEQIALITSYRAIQIREPAFPLIGIGLRRMIRRLAILVVRRLMAAVIKFAFHDGQQLVITRNMIVVLQPRSPG